VGLDFEALVRPEDEEISKLEPPCRVLLHNDDVTPVDYVPGLLRRVFRLGPLKALWVTLRAHVAGVALVVVEARSEAEAHVAQAHELARSDGHPRLTLTVEPVDS
jgi:ATP-dependent Clp protease adaptor protein ClpS